MILVMIVSLLPYIKGRGSATSMENVEGLKNYRFRERRLSIERSQYASRPLNVSRWDKGLRSIASDTGATLL